MSYKPPILDATSEPNVVPMADIMLVLLIIFMVVTPMLQKGFSVDLARTDNATEMKEADQEDAVLLSVSRDGKIYLGSQQIAMEQVIEEVRDRFEASSVKTVFIKSDRRAKYGRVAQLVDEVRAIGVDQLGLLTEKIKKGVEMPAGVMAPASLSGSSD